MRLIATVLLAWAVSFTGQVLAQADIGLLDLVSGNVSFVPQAGQPGKARSFMKVREGDRFELPSGAQVRVLFYEGGRQERWHGPASFRAGRAQSVALNGAPSEVRALPKGVPQRMARVPDLMQHARLGGVQVRGAGSLRRASDESLADARATYESLRTQLAPDDVTAELYLFSALNEHQLYDEMAPLVQAMLRKQPASDEVKALAAWLKGRSAK
jgi:hypothetical protein